MVRWPGNYESARSGGISIKPRAEIYSAANERKAVRDVCGGATIDFDRSNSTIQPARGRSFERHKPCPSPPVPLSPPSLSRCTPQPRHGLSASTLQHSTTIQQILGGVIGEGNAFRRAENPVSKMVGGSAMPFGAREADLDPLRARRARNTEELAIQRGRGTARVGCAGEGWHYISEPASAIIHRPFEFSALVITTNTRQMNRG